jgi:transposase
MTTMLERSEEMVDKQVRGKYTLEYKVEAVRQVKAGPSAAVVAKVLGIPSASLSNWVRLDAKGQLGGAAANQKAPEVRPEQMEIARLRAENARLKMERDIAKMAAAYFAQDVLQSTPGYGK